MLSFYIRNPEWFAEASQCSATSRSSSGILPVNETNGLTITLFGGRFLFLPGKITHVGDPNDSSFDTTYRVELERVLGNRTKLKRPDGSITPQLSLAPYDPKKNKDFMAKLSASDLDLSDPEQLVQYLKLTLKNGVFDLRVKTTDELIELVESMKIASAAFARMVGRVAMIEAIADKVGFNKEVLTLTAAQFSELEGDKIFKKLQEAGIVGKDDSPKMFKALELKNKARKYFVTEE